MVEMPNAVRDPRTVVVETQHASLAYGAMMCPLRFGKVALLTGFWELLVFLKFLE
jgi:hypothetical protein